VHAHAGREHAVRTHLRPDVFGNKNLTFAADWLADDFVEHQVFRHHARQEGCNRRLSHLLAVSPDMSRHPRHDRNLTYRLLGLVYTASKSHDVSDRRTSV
jgi:hypothetical protein